MTPTMPKEGTQEARLLDVLLNAQGDWINGQYFLREMYLSQYHRAIHTLQNKYHWPIEPSEFTDQFKFKSYRLGQEVKTLALSI